MIAARYHSNYLDSMLKILGKNFILYFRKDNHTTHNIISNHELVWRVTHYKYFGADREPEYRYVYKKYKKATLHKDIKNLQINNTIIL